MFPKQDVECGINFSKPSRLIINQTKPGKPGECIEMKKMKKSRRPKERHVEKSCQPDIDDKQCDAESNQHYPECNVEDTNQCCADTRGRDMQDTRENHIDEAETKESDIESCRICQEASDHSPLVSPCKCSGSIQFVHIDCLEDWIDSTGDTVCEICQTRYDITANMKPFKEVPLFIIISWGSISVKYSKLVFSFCNASLQAIQLNYHTQISQHKQTERKNTDLGLFWGEV